MAKKNNISIGDALARMVSDYKLSGKLDEVRIRQSWERIMGKPIARYTASISLKSRKLYIQIDSAPLKQELSYSKEKVKELINAEIGHDAVDEVIIF